MEAQRRRTGVAVVFAALALAGCGSESGRSLEDFAQDAENACRENGRAIAKLGKPDDNESALKWANGSLVAFQQSIRDINAIELPEGDDGERAEAFAKAWEEDISTEYIPKLRALHAALTAGAQEQVGEALRALPDIDTPKSDELAKDIGATSCADPS